MRNKKSPIAAVKCLYCGEWVYNECKTYNERDTCTQKPDAIKKKDDSKPVQIYLRPEMMQKLEMLTKLLGSTKTKVFENALEDFFESHSDRFTKLLKAQYNNLSETIQSMETIRDYMRGDDCTISDEEKIVLETLNRHWDELRLLPLFDEPEI